MDIRDSLVQFHQFFLVDQKEHRSNQRALECGVPGYQIWNADLIAKKEKKNGYSDPYALRAPPPPPPQTS